MFSALSFIFRECPAYERPGVPVRVQHGEEEPLRQRAHQPTRAWCPKVCSGQFSGSEPQSSYIELIRTHFVRLQIRILLLMFIRIRSRTLSEYRYIRIQLKFSNYLKIKAFIFAKVLFLRNQLFIAFLDFEYGLKIRPTAKLMNSHFPLRSISGFSRSWLPALILFRFFYVLVDTWEQLCRIQIRLDSELFAGSRNRFLPKRNFIPYCNVYLWRKWYK